MVSIPQNQTGINGLLHRAAITCEISRQDHLQLTSAMLSTPNMAASDRTRINRLLDLIRSGKVRVVD